MSDGAAAVLLTRRSVAQRLGLPIIGKFVAAVATGVPPRIMGVGPAYAIPKVLEKTGLTKEDIDFFEINEAFASQAVYSVQTLGIPFEKVNKHGGAIAIGHPLGCSESYLVLSVLDIDELSLCSWCAANRNGFEYREAVQRENLHHQYVYRIRHGHGWYFRE